MIWPELKRSTGFLLFVGLAASSGPALRAELPPLLPRALILEDADRTLPLLSPDGRRLAYLAAHDGVRTIWVRTLGHDDDRPVIRDSRGDIGLFRWRTDGKGLLYFQDSGGDEEPHLFQADPETGAVRDMTPLPGVRASALVDSPRFPHIVLVHLNARDRRRRDAHRLDLETGALELVAENPGDVDRFYADDDLAVRAAEARPTNGGREVRVRDGAGSSWRPLLGWGPDEIDSDNTGVVGFGPGGASLLVVTSLGTDAECLLEVECRTGERKVVAADPHFDVHNWLLNPLDGRVEGASFLRAKEEWAFFDTRVAADFKALGRASPGEICVLSRDRADRTWVVAFRAPDRPKAFFLFDRASGKADFLFSEDPKLERFVFANMEPVSFRAKDGMMIHAYLTRPIGVPAINLSLVVLVHGGPWARDTWSLSFIVQWLANRGYAVLQVNFRGSTGYGKVYQNAGDLQWGGAIIQDIVDGKDWVVARGIADPKRIAVMGGSFGGYAALACLAFHPTDFACGVDMGGPSDLDAFLRAIPARWATTRAQWEKRMGKDEGFLRRISPLFSADRVVRPLFISHNANDTRVSLDQSDRMAAAVRRRGTPVTYLVFQNAGHLGGGGLADVHRRYAAIEDFLAGTLGGRVEPPGENETWEHLKR